MKYRELKKYQYGLMEIYRINVNLPDAFGNFMSVSDGTLVIRKHYAWDGSSVPLKRCYKWIWNADKYCKTASLVHDALCQLIREDLLPMKYKEQVDTIYRDMCIAKGMPSWQANTRYKMIRKYGDKYVLPGSDSRGKILED